MKNLILILGLLVVALATALLLRERDRGAQAIAATTSQLEASNQVFELKLKLEHQERLNRVLETNLAASAQEMLRFSTQLTRFRLDLQKADQAAHAAQGETQAQKQRAEEAAAAREALSRQLLEEQATRAAVQQELTGLKQQFEPLASERTALQAQAVNLRTENGKMSQTLQDPAALRSRLAALKQESSVAKPTPAQAKSAPRPNRNGKLTLQPDGSVAFADPVKPAKP
jgi:hypothetical protein